MHHTDLCSPQVNTCFNDCHLHGDDPDGDFQRKNKKQVSDETRNLDVDVHSSKSVV